MEVVSRDTYIPYMKVKHINVDIVNLKQQYNKVLTNTSSQYIRVKNINVNFVIIKQQ